MKIIDFIKQHLIATFFLVLDLILIIVIVVLQTTQSTKTATVDINVVPSTAQVIIDGHTYNSVGTYSVHPGATTVTISAEGFETKTLNLNFETDKITRITACLKNNDNGLAYYIENTEDRKIALKLVDYFDDETVAYLNRISIVDQLPIYYYESATSSIHYRILIDENKACDSDLCISINDYTGQSRAAAEAKITSLGYNLDDYEIIYTAYISSMSGSR